MNCDFYANYVNSLILIDQTNIVYPDLRPNALSVSQAYGQIHFALINTDFSYIYSSVDFITYLMKRTVHNIVIESVTVNYVYSGDSGIININNLGYLKESDYNGATTTVVIDGEEVQVTIQPRYFRIFGLEINYCASGLTVLSIQTMPGVDISDLSISSVYDGNIENIASIVQEFINSSKYLSITPSSGELSLMNCASITSLTNIHYSYIGDIDISYVSCYCNSGPAGLTINSIRSLDMNNIYIHDIWTYSRSGNALSIINISNQLNLKSLRIENVGNSNAAVVQMKYVYYLRITGMWVYNIVSDSISPVSIELSTYINMLDISFQWSMSNYGNGGSLYFITSNCGYTQTVIVNSYFDHSWANYGVGGAIFFDSHIATDQQYIQILNATFTNCGAMDGTAIYIGERMAFFWSSSITDIKISNCWAKQGGMITDYHYGGSLTIINLVMHDNSGMNAGVVAMYPVPSDYYSCPSEAMLYVRLLKISNSQSFGSLIILDSYDKSLLAELDNVMITNVTNKNGGFADTFSISQFTVVMSRLNITRMNQAIVAQTYSTVNISSSTFNNITGNLIVLYEEVNFNFINSSASYFNDSLIVADKDSSVHIYNSSFTQIQGYFAKINNGVSLNCSFCNMSFVNHTIVSAESSSNVSISDSIIKFISGSFVVLNNQAHFSCIRCDVTQIYDSLITANLDSSVFIMSSSFYSNQVKLSNRPTISIGSSTTTSYFIDTRFIENLATASDSFHFSSITLIISGCAFSGNSAPSSAYTGIYAFGTNLTVSNSTFSDQKSSKQGSFLYILGGSFVIIHNTSFIKGSTSYGGAIYIDSSSLLINSSIFQDNIGSVAGGSIYATDTNINISNTAFTAGLSMLGDAIYMDLQALNISNCVFQGSMTTSNSYTSTVYAVNSRSIIVLNSSFSFPANNISALIAVGASSVNISDSLFQNISGVMYGAVSCIGGTSGGNVNILRTRFINNYSPNNGGGLLVQDLGLEMIDSVVKSNYAGFDGGGMDLTSPNCKTCAFSIRGATNITDNIAIHQGGAIKWSDYKPGIDTTVVIQNNSASYGGDLASIPCSIKPLSRRQLSDSADFIIFNAAPGQICTEVLNISLLDTYGNVITTDSSSTLLINTMIEYPDLSLRGNDTFTAKQGVFSIYSFTPSGPPGSTQQFTATTNGISSTSIPNDNSTYSNSAIIEIFLRNCISGEQITNSECIICKEGTFLLKPELSCLPCPTGGICPGGTMLVPKPGYWRSSNASEIVYACPLAGACLGNSTATDGIGQCSEGYEGVMCSSCMGGYTKTSNGYCNVCPSKGSNVVILLVIIGVVLLLCIILIKTTIRSAFSTKEHYSIYIKIFTNYLQLMSLTANFNFNWPTYVLELFNVQQQAVSGADTLFSVDCYLSTKGTGNVGDSYYYELILMALLPFIIFAISSLAWLGVTFHTMDYSYLKRELLLTVIILVFLVYPNITIFNFSHFDCRAIDMLGSFLRTNYAIQCWTERYTLYALIVVIPCIILWVIGLPTLVLVIMIKRRRKLNRDNNKVIFGFLFNGYRKVRFYWEFIIMYRKVVIISICVFLSDLSLTLQALTILLVMTWTSFLHYKLDPYNSVELNNMEMEALITSTLTLYCGLYYLTRDVGVAFQMILFCLILLGNGYFICYWLYWVTLAMLDIVVQYFPNIRYLFRKGDAYSIEFYQEPISRPGSYYEEAEGVRLYTFMSTEPRNNTQSFNITSMNALYQHALIQENIDYRTKIRKRLRVKRDLDLEDEDKTKQTTEDSKHNEDPNENKEYQECINDTHKSILKKKKHKDKRALDHMLEEEKVESEGVQRVEPEESFQESIMIDNISEQDIDDIYVRVEDQVEARNGINDASKRLEF